MALNGSYVDIDFILDKLEHDFGFSDIIYNEVVEDVWDIIGYVLDPDSFERKFSDIVIADYRGIMPTNFYSIVDGAVIETSTNIPLVTSTDLLDRFSSNTTILADTDALDYTYRILKGYIYTGIENTTITVSYKSFPTENSLPLIPDNAKAIRAIVNYIGERIAFRLMLKDKLSERKYEIVKQESLFTTAAFKTSSKIPSLDGMERLKNMHLNILRNPNHHDSQFQNLGKRSRVYSSPVNINGLNNTLDMTLTATANNQTSFDRTYEISSNNLDTIKSLGVWVVTLSGTDNTLTYGTDVSYNSTTDVITYIPTNYGVTTIADTIVFTYNIQ